MMSYKDVYRTLLLCIFVRNVTFWPSALLEKILCRMNSMGLDDSEAIRHTSAYFFYEILTFCPQIWSDSNETW